MDGQTNMWTYRAAMNDINNLKPEIKKISSLPWFESVVLWFCTKWMIKHYVLGGCWSFQLLVNKLLERIFVCSKIWSGLKFHSTRAKINYYIIQWDYPFLFPHSFVLNILPHIFHWKFEPTPIIHFYSTFKQYKISTLNS